MSEPYDPSDPYAAFLKRQRSAGQQRGGANRQAATDLEPMIRELRGKGLSWREIGEQLGKSYERCRQIGKGLGIK